MLAFCLGSSATKDFCRLNPTLAFFVCLQLTIMRAGLTGINEFIKEAIEANPFKEELNYILARKKKILYCLLFFFVIYLVCHLQYDDIRFAPKLKPWLWIVLGVAGSRCLGKRNLALAIFVILGYGFVSLFAALSYFMCGDFPQGDKYVNINHPSIKIVAWSEDCGAWDSSPTYDLYKQYKITSHLNYYVKLDEGADIDTATWKPAN